MVKNHKLAKSISDAAWSQFAQWLEYFGQVYGKTVSAVAPQYTSQNCSKCGNSVLKTLSTRTHICGCGTTLGSRSQRWLQYFGERVEAGRNHFKYGGARRN